MRAPGARVQLDDLALDPEHRHPLDVVGDLHAEERATGHGARRSCRRPSRAAGAGDASRPLDCSGGGGCGDAQRPRPPTMGTWLQRDPAASPARRAARLLRRCRPGRGHRREGPRALRAPGLRPQGDRPQQARRARRSSGAARSSSTRPTRSPRARPSSSPPTASPRSSTSEARERSLTTIDATCPLVTKVHNEAVRFADDDYDILLIGHEGHEEVVGTSGEAPEHITLVDGPDDVANVEVRDPEKVVWLSQTTLSVDETMETVAPLRERFPALQDPPSDDICYATQNRQLAVKQMAERLRPRARRRLAELLELRAAGRGRPRARGPRRPPRRLRRRDRRRRGWTA